MSSQDGPTHDPQSPAGRFSSPAPTGPAAARNNRRNRRRVGHRGRLRSLSFARQGPDSRRIANFRNPRRPAANIAPQGHDGSGRSSIGSSPSSRRPASGHTHITKLIPSGTRVKKGDLLVEFDRQAQLRDAIDKQAQSDDENEKVIEEQPRKRPIAPRTRPKSSRQKTVSAKPNWRWRRLSCSPASTLKKAQEDLDEAQATLAQLKQTFELKRKARGLHSHS